ncbi:MAG: YihY/virulence factor BrkB family protein [Chloroflexi bacterium]|nr:YihY/virulence factor BrkB family protein [Chloroflexota bacterium]MYG91237.1 YihY/virulence factor BrkB family protein [Chloroflexota bacterium]MYJ92360.1 YihY/virulence factor BrkB family protein [Chloroflexota bacterium]
MRWSPQIELETLRERGLRWRRWLVLHLGWWRTDLRLLAKRSVSEFLDDHCAQLAASMSYYVFFSLFPLAILVVSIAGVLLTDDSLREEVVDGLFELLPLQSGAGKEDLEQLIEPIADGRSAVGVISVLGLIWAATGMMSALRFSLDSAWDLEFRRPFVRGKLVDLGLVLGVGGLLTISIGATAVLQVGTDVSDSVSDSLGPFGAEATGFFRLVTVLLPFLLTWTTFTIIYKVVPSVTTRVRDVVAGALVGALLFEALKHGFAFYLRNFSNYDAVYGSLGAAIALLFFVYLAACVLLFGAEIAAEWPRVMYGHYDDEDDEAEEETGPTTLRERVRQAAARQLIHDQPIPSNAPDEGARTARQERRSAERSKRLGDE